MLTATDSRHCSRVSPPSHATGASFLPSAIQHAHANGFTLLTATTLWENRAARMLLRRNGFRARHTHGGEIEHELKLEAVGLSPQGCVVGGHEDPQADESSAEVIGACTSSLPSATACHPWPKPVAYPEIRSLDGYVFPGGRS